MLDLNSFIAGLAVGFTACIILWFWIEQRNAEMKNVTKK